MITQMKPRFGSLEELKREDYVREVNEAYYSKLMNIVSLNPKLIF